MTSWPESMRSRNSPVVQFGIGDEQPGSARAALTSLRQIGAHLGSPRPLWHVTPVQEVSCVEMGWVAHGCWRRFDSHHCRQGGGLVHSHHRRSDLRYRDGRPYQSQQCLVVPGGRREMSAIPVDAHTSGMMESHAMTRTIPGRCITHVQDGVAARKVVC